MPWRLRGGHSEGVTAFASLGGRLVTGSEDGSVCLWPRLPAAVSGAGSLPPAAHTVLTPGMTVGALAADSVEEGILYAACGLRVAVLEVVEGERGPSLSLLHSGTYNGDDVGALARHPTTPLLAAADDDGLVALLDASSPRTGLRLLRVLRGGHDNIVSAAVWGSGGPSLPLITGGLDCTLSVWGGAKGGMPLVRMHVAGAVRVRAGASGVAWEGLPLDEGGGGGRGGSSKGSKRGKAGAGRGGADSPRIGFRTGAPPPNLSGPGLGQLCNPPFVHALEASPCGAFLVSAVGDGSVTVWGWSADPGGGEDEGPGGPGGFLIPRWHAPYAHASAATCLAFVHLPGGRTVLASGGNDRSVALWPWAELLGEVRACGAGVAGGDAALPAARLPLPRSLHTLGAGGALGGGLLAVGDTGRGVTLYDVHQLLP
jgi:WD40 repeat protein